VRDYVYPVGRLDFASEGLLLLTNDGDLAAQLTHPRHGVARVYEVKVLGLPDEHDLERLSRGMTIEGQRTAPATVRLLGDERHAASASRRPTRARGLAAPGARRRESGNATLEIVLKEGRNRQVRKMCEAIGHPVERLRRVAIGPIRDARLKPGQWRDLTKDEIVRLRKAARPAPREEASPRL
jgi:pseudouridine synthase